MRLLLPTIQLPQAKCIFCDKGRNKIKGKLVYHGKSEKYETEIIITDPATDKSVKLRIW